MIDKAIAREIGAGIEGEVLLSEPMYRHTTYRTGGEAEIMVVAENGDDSCRAYQFARKNDIPLTVIGAGSNVIAPDAGIEGIVLKTRSENARIDWRDDGKVKTDGGVYLDTLIRKSAQRNIGGFEHITGIPGTVGGAIFMNAGTKGGEICELIDSAEAVSEDGRLLVLRPEDMRMGYRTSIIQENGWLLVNAVFNVIDVNGEETSRKIESVWKERSILYPMDMPSAGSVFRNPEGSHAGYLIEQTGLRGMEIGGARVSEKHGNFIINTGNATSADIIELIEMIREKIFETHGIRLMLEQRILPVCPRV